VPAPCRTDIYTSIGRAGIELKKPVVAGRSGSIEDRHFCHPSRGSGEGCSDIVAEWFGLRGGLKAGLFLH